MARPVQHVLDPIRERALEALAASKMNQIATAPDTNLDQMSREQLIAHLGLRLEAERVLSPSNHAGASEARLRTRLEALDRAGMAVSSGLAMLSGEGALAVLQVIVDQARILADASYAALGFGDDPERPFAPWVFSGMGPAHQARLGQAPRAVGVLGVVARAETLRLSDLREHPAFQGFPAHHPRMKSFLGVPVRYGSQRHGTLYVADKRGAEAFDADDERTLEMLAERVGAAVKIVRLRESEARERERLDLLVELGNALTSSLEASVIAAAIARAAVPRLSDCCAVHLCVGERLCLAALAHRDGAQQERLGARVQEAGSAAGGVVARVASTMRPELHQRPVEDVLAGVEVESVMVVPLVARGALSFVYTGSGRAYEPGDLTLAEEIARRAALALDNARLFEEARAAVRARDVMLATVAHDLRNPLGLIVLAAELIPPEECKQAEVIARTALRMSRLVDDLLSASTLVAGRFVGEPRSYSVSTLLDEAIESTELLAAARGIRLTRGAPAALPAVLCDPDRTLQVLSNLLGNATKFTPRGGEIRIEATPREGHVCFAVSDTGPGIQEEHLSRLFEPYWQGKPSSSPGVGLGLYIAKSIVDALGGRIWVESEVGEGTTFFFTLPLAPALPG